MKILRLAIPAIVTNITVPLLGLVDTSITGHLDNVAYIGAVSVGSMLFNMIYWNFGFLRMGTSGLTAQAFGRRDFESVANVLFRALFFAFAFAVLIGLIQFPVIYLAFHWMKASPEVEMFARQYFYICIWGAPAILGMYAFKGWFIGMQNTFFPMIIAVSMNVVNIIASLFFVFALHWGVAGVASATLLAQYVGLTMAFVLWCWRYKRFWKYLNFSKAMECDGLKAFFSINGGIFLRTLCLNAVMSFFTFAGARFGDVILAVNVLLMQMFNLFSYFTDGFAYAGEALVGKYLGANNRSELVLSINAIFRWGVVLVLVFSFVYAIGAIPFIHILTTEDQVRALAPSFFGWVVLVPIVGVSAFLWDGIMVGATLVKPMISATFLACLSFFVVFGGSILLSRIDGFACLASPCGLNHSLWLAFIVYLLVRGLVQHFWMRNNWSIRLSLF
ncbi:MAG: MATE family efflux transporter [Bacteroidales bacterium]|nr:MATE family efflux transporter [Candidatus Physcocola equi]